LLIGRDEPLDEIAESLDEGSGSPWRSTICTGERGMGKTALLGEVEVRARDRGWVVIRETATRGFIERMVKRRLPEAIARAALGAEGASPFVGVYIRSKMEALTSLLPEGTGLLVILDGMRGARVHEFVEMATSVQHLFREDRDMAFVVAGSQHEVGRVLRNPQLGFFSRSELCALGTVSLKDAAEAMRRPIESHGRSIGDAPCGEAAEATEGHPLMIQLVGHHAWEQHPDAQEVSLSDVRAAVPIARRRLGVLLGAA
jgi:hypothetical protein